jgi:hypothetical protein
MLTAYQQAASYEMKPLGVSIAAITAGRWSSENLPSAVEFDAHLVPYIVNRIRLEPNLAAAHGLMAVLKFPSFTGVMTAKAQLMRQRAIEINESCAQRSTEESIRYAAGLTVGFMADWIVCVKAGSKERSAVSDFFAAVLERVDEIDRASSARLRVSGRR